MKILIFLQHQQNHKLGIKYPETTHCNISHLFRTIALRVHRSNLTLHAAFASV